jgi:hypothetical protein
MVIHPPVNDINILALGEDNSLRIDIGTELVV